MRLHIFSILFLLIIAFLNINIAVQPDPTPEKKKREYIQKVTLSFSGDLIQHMPQLSAANNGDGTYDFSKTFAHIEPVWKSVDFAVINYETTVSANGRYTGFPYFSSPSDVAEELYRSGIRVMALANNHACDKGRIGVENTIKTLDSIGFKTVGVYADSTSAQEILMLTKGSFRVALLNYTYGTNGIRIPRGAVVNLIDTTKIKNDILRARKDSAATHVVAFMHWGEEYQRRANKAQKEVGLWCSANGVDAVIGSHAHVVQEIDTVNNIVYSLGNFISNQQDQYTDSGLTVILTLKRGKKAVIEYLPHWCDKFAPTRKEKYRVLTARDTVLHRGEPLARMKRALNEARRAVGNATEYVLSGE